MSAEEVVLCGAFRRRVDCAVEVVDIGLEDEGRCLDGRDIAMADFSSNWVRSEELLDVGRVFR
jgi:hypothetical protein